VAEASYLIGKYLGSNVEAAFFRSLTGGALKIDTGVTADIQRIADLIGTYSGLSLGGTDASIVAAAERLGIYEIATLDRRHFTVVRPAHVDALTLLP